MPKRVNRKTSNRVQICKIGELFELIRQREILLEEYYGAIRDKSEDNGVKLLSYYLGKHYRQLCSILDDFSPRKIQRIQGRKLQQKLEVSPEEWTAFPPIPPARIQGKALLDMAILYNRKLTAIYNKLLHQPLAKDTTALISALKRLEDNDSATFKKMVAMNYY